jgi:import inner membrane translocase subunit TIM50
MLPALRLAASRRLPVARLAFQQNPHTLPLTRINATNSQSSLLTRITAGQTRWASNGNKNRGQPVKNVLTFKKEEKSAPSSQASKAPESTPKVEESLETAEHTEAQTPPRPSKPLPDLRYGIPSTFEAEYMKGHEQDGEPVSHRNLDITDAEAETERPKSSGGAGGEIPKSAYESSIDKRRNKMAKYFFMSAVLLAVGGTVWLGRDWESEEEAKRFPQAPSGFAPGLFYNRIMARLGDQMGYYTEPTFPKLLPNVDNQMMPPYTLVFSLEDFLVHSEWTREHGWRTAKRPGCDFFLLYLSQYYELCLFTSVSMGIADPVVRKLDPYHLIMWPLFREATRYEGGDYVKVTKDSLHIQLRANLEPGSLISQSPD